MRARLALSLLALAAAPALADRAATVKAPLAPPAPGSAAVGKPAPDFELTDTDGKTLRLSSLRGKTVVLEWFNPDCPFVKYSHGEGPLHELAGTMGDKGVAWVAINSSAPGKQGNGLARNKKARADWKLAHPILLDERGVVGKAYGAKSTPHMYVIDAAGVLVYAGALDNAPMGRLKGDRVDYLVRAVTAVLAGKKVDVAETQSYGCSVKYD